ncbi:MAG: hypothetical protein COT71_02995 [Candidatus Andersenbacteria bacterium CG10_big_fil_rev_8_21_14_0_10_54_11]|uniref:Glycosyltransferase RgtA/B/C/D-like domain-containing protein n=1 Tax=Candidatus Andersenbacteria bacterium CG10_big_fil_rev_8_21_14_0_10_54_11 TaxID=1974485 RepID=A0A2M6WZ16_9BACT|nr:MAG: hypothetical protein COT71_02995 [Candidatus Andersenbacteria bacterium CG10_big_fil_rev_8_21_14_0_10_54_11]
MQTRQPVRGKIIHGISLLLLILLLAFPRLLDLNATRSPDEDRWMANTAGFTRKLANVQLRDLVQQPHPGITTQWLGALTIRFDNWETRKLPVVIGNVLLIFAASYVFGQLWGKTTGFFTILALGFDPLLYAHTRVYAMDALLSLFAVVSLGLLLLWHQKKENRYLAAAGVTAAAAGLSKLPGFILAPFTILLLLQHTIAAAHGAPQQTTKSEGRTRQLLSPLALYCVSFFAGIIIILPSFGLAPRSVIGSLAELFRSDEYQEKHQLGAGYYVRSLIFFSAPLQAAGLMALAAAVRRKKLPRRLMTQLGILALFAALFWLQMSLGAKKGDRYILPVFAALDIISAAGIASSLTATGKRNPRQCTAAVLALIVLWQIAIIWQLHPHNLAYVNPLTRPWFGMRRHGWGEGLSLAADYLNAKPNAGQLKVASYYPNEFGAYFRGETVPAHQHDTAGVDYVVLYRAMLERGPHAWETDVVNRYLFQTPEHTIRLGGLDYLWIYRTPPQSQEP